MATSLKPLVAAADTLERLEIRLGRVVDAQPAPGAPKAAYLLTVDFGKFGRRVSVGRFTGHPAAEMVGRQVLGVLNFGARRVGDTTSEVLILGVPFPGAASGEATFLTSAVDAEVGSRVF